MPYNSLHIYYRDLCRIHDLPYFLFIGFLLQIQMCRCPPTSHWPNPDKTLALSSRTMCTLLAGSGMWALGPGSSWDNDAQCHQPTWCCHSICRKLKFAHFEASPLQSHVNGFVLNMAIQSGHHVKRSPHELLGWSLMQSRIYICM